MNEDDLSSFTKYALTHSFGLQIRANFKSEQTLGGVVENIYTQLALYGSKNECARTDTVLFHISGVCDGTVSLTSIK